ncbi:hypothetical protein AABB24_003396 [Solanum stoloniferum]|uniref:Reverse transcriptase Ty1/copia-type domain-containing protein n=1 Tax=Solanum stoloniferum TaxID=62892 RepID=A0ABD2VB22_9SOLN
MDQEIQALSTNKTWDIVDLPLGKSPIGCKWVYKIKFKADGSVERYKARLVAKGFTQQEGIDYHDTFSPVVKMVTVRCVVALAAQSGWCLFQMDVYNAFLQGDLFEEVYMSLPPGFGSQGENKVCRLLKSLYGLKQASRQWNQKLTNALMQSGFTQSKLDYSLFTKTNSTGDIVIILIYVDDLLITGSSDRLIQEAKDTLHHNFKMKDLGELRYFLGIEFARSKDGILMNQRRYALELVSECGLAGSKPTSTPLEQNQKLTSVEYDRQFNITEYDELEDRRIYQRLIGRLLYLAMTRPDISFAV